MKSENILLLGDITGRSRVALRMMTAVLEARGHETLALPTALISNTLNLGAHEQLDTTDYLLASLRTWKKLGLSYSYAAIGYITGLAQARALCAVADEARANGAYVLVDPILGDGGKKYNSVTDEQAEGMRMLMEHADLITPNLTEACLLTNTPFEAARSGGAVLFDMARRLSQGKRSVLITSCYAEDGGRAVLVCDNDLKETMVLPYTHVEGHYFGTGDLYSALLVHALTQGSTLYDAAKAAAQQVRLELMGRGEGWLPVQKLT